MLVSVFWLGACSHKITKETEYTSDGRVSYQRTMVNDEIISQLRRVFQNRTIEGIGIFENANEGLARRSAINLAIAELAGQVQTLVRSESVIYNNKDVRDVVENRVKALVNNYRIDSAGYDPGTNVYRARVSISGEELIREIEEIIR